MIACAEHSKAATKTLLKLIGDFSKCVGCKVDTQKNLCTPNHNDYLEVEIKTKKYLQCLGVI